MVSGNLPSWSKISWQKESRATVPDLQKARLGLATSFGRRQVILKLHKARAVGFLSVLSGLHFQAGNGVHLYWPDGR